MNGMIYYNVTYLFIYITSATRHAFLYLLATIAPDAAHLRLPLLLVLSPRRPLSDSCDPMSRVNASFVQFGGVGVVSLVALKVSSQHRGPPVSSDHV